MSQTTTLPAPLPVNEPVRSYAPGTPERDSLQHALSAISGNAIEIPLMIGGREVFTGRTATAAMPHDHRHTLATWHKAGAAEVEQAIAAAASAHRDWAAWKQEDR